MLPLGLSSSTSAGISLLHTKADKGRMPCITASGTASAMPEKIFSDIALAIPLAVFFLLLKNCRLFNPMPWRYAEVGSGWSGRVLCLVHAQR